MSAAALLGVVLLLCVGVAGPAAAACGNGYASTALTNRCLLDLFEQSRDPAARKLLGRILVPRLVQEGYARSIGLRTVPDVHRLRFALRPVVRYSNNLNGGDPDDPFFLGPFRFTFPEETQRREGLLVGAEIDVDRRFRVGEGRTLDLGATAMAGHAPEEDVSVLEGGVSACYHDDPGKAYRVDVCSRFDHVDRKLSNSKSVVHSLDITRFFHIDGYRRLALGVGIDLQDNGSFEQVIHRLSGEFILPSDHVVNLSLARGRSVAGENALDHSIRASISGDVGPIDGRLSVSQSEYSGDSLFGTAREERIRSISFAVPVARLGMLSVGYTDRDSTIDFLDDAYPTVGLELAKIRF